MSVVSVTCRRTLTRARSLYATGLALAIFLAAAAFLFLSRLEAAEGLRQSVPVLWASSVSLFLPLLAAFLGADIWSEDRRTGRIDLLLSAAVRERDLALGKFFGVWTLVAFATLFSLVASVAVLFFMAPAALGGLSLLSFAPAVVILLLEGAFWAAAAAAVSAQFTNGFASLVVSLVLFVALPRGLWTAAHLWMKKSAALGAFPVDALVEDFASGFVSAGSVAAIVVLTALCVFLASQSVVRLRFSGRSSRGGRLSTGFTMALGLVAALSVSVLALRLDVPLDLQVESGEDVSPRMQHFLADAPGTVVATAFVSRRDPLFRSVARRLRALKHAAEASGGLSLQVQYVDPAWDFGEATRLVRLGAKEGSLVFERASRHVSLSLADCLAERAVLSALQSIILPKQRREICWTTGHGELRFDAYDERWGLSDIARELVRGGYRNRTISLASDGSVPAECALIAVAGAKDPFSRDELNRLDAYLRGGGRLLVLIGPSTEGGVAPLLPAWGVRPVAQPLVDAPTLSGSDVIVADFPEHALTTGFAGSRLVLESPLSFQQTSVASAVAGADQLSFASLARVGAANVAVLVERGAGAGSDLAVRPTRMVVVGDSTFVANGPLASRGCANAAFFLNAVAYLSGAEVADGVEDRSGVFSTGLDRKGHRRLVVASVGVLPACLFVILSLAVLRRRHRT